VANRRAVRLGWRAKSMERADKNGEGPMDLSVMDKHSSRRLAFSAVFWSCLGGIEIGQGIQQILARALNYPWIVPFLMGFAFLAYGIFWAVMLVRRIGSTT
jgi:hypothetical protein